MCKKAPSLMKASRCTKSNIASCVKSAKINVFGQIRVLFSKWLSGGEGKTTWGISEYIFHKNKVKRIYAQLF